MSCFPVLLVRANNHHNGSGWFDRMIASELQSEMRPQTDRYSKSRMARFWLKLEVGRDPLQKMDVTKFLGKWRDLQYPIKSLHCSRVVATSYRISKVGMEGSAASADSAF